MRSVDWFRLYDRRRTDTHTHTHTFLLKHIFRLWEWCRIKNHEKKSKSNFLTIAILPSLLMSLESKTTHEYWGRLYDLWDRSLEEIWCPPNNQMLVTPMYKIIFNWYKIRILRSIADTWCLILDMRVTIILTPRVGNWTRLIASCGNASGNKYEWSVDGSSNEPGQALSSSIHACHHNAVSYDNSCTERGA